LTDYDRSNPVTAKEATKKFILNIGNSAIDEEQKKMLISSQMQILDKDVLELLEQYSQLREFESRVEEYQGEQPQDPRFKRRGNINKFVGKAQLIRTKTRISKIMPAKGAKNLL
jgi:hypothetical protein